MKSLGWALTQYDSCPHKTTNYGKRYIKRKVWGEDIHLQAKERVLKQILPSWPPEETKPASTLILEF